MSIMLDQLENYFNKDKILDHISNEHGDCVDWCYRCAAIQFLEKHCVDLSTVDLFEMILDFNLRQSKLYSKIEELEKRVKAFIQQQNGM